MRHSKRTRGRIGDRERGERKGGVKETETEREGIDMQGCNTAAE